MDAHFSVRQRVQHRKEGLIGTVVGVERRRVNIIDEDVTYRVRWDIGGEEPEIDESELAALPQMSALR